jgi:hypothetical protein
MRQKMHLKDARVLKRQRAFHARFDQSERALHYAAGAAAGL